MPEMKYPETSTVNTWIDEIQKHTNVLVGRNQTANETIKGIIVNCEESKPMRVLLTGASGYLGQAIYKMGQNCFDWNLFDWLEPELG